MRHTNNRCGIFLGLAFGGLVGFTNTALASGFAILEQSASRLGTAFAGSGTSSDPTVLYFNPAGMGLLNDTQAAASVSAINIESTFSDRGSVAALGQPLGSEGGNAGSLNWVPSAYFSSWLNDRTGLGFSVTAPFGLKLEYEDEWLGRFQARRSQIKTLNLNPVVAFRFNRVITIAVGANYQHLNAELTNAVNTTAVIAQGLQLLVASQTITPTQAAALATANSDLEGHSIVSGEDWAWGANAGVLIDLGNGQMSLAYRSPITYHVSGDVEFSEPTPPEPIGTGIVAAASAPGSILSDGSVQVSLKVPASATASFLQRVSPRFTILSELAWTQWSSVQELRVLRPTGTTLSVTPENWRDTWRAAFGTEFDLSPSWKLRGGIAFDQTPVSDSNRTPRLPDSDRKWIAVGAGWKPNLALSMDFGYAHLFTSDVPINQDGGNAAAYGVVIGEQSNAIDILAVQVGWKF